MGTALRDSGRVWIQVRREQVQLHVQGAVSHVHGEPLRGFIAQMVERGFRRFVLDLGECTQLDSAFVGSLAGISLDLEEARAPKLLIPRVAAEQRALIKTCGVESFFDFDLYPLGDARFEAPPERGLHFSEALAFTDLFDHDGTEALKPTRRPPPPGPGGARF